MEFSERLTKLRKRKNITQKEMADFLGVTRGAYSQYEIGRREPNYDTTIQIANLLSVSLDYLLTGKEFQQNDNKYDCQECLEIKDKLHKTEKELENILEIIKSNN